MRYSSLYSYMVSLAVASMLVAGCSDGGGDKPEPGPTQYTKPIMAKDSKSDQALDQLTFVVGSDTTENVSKITLTREEETSERVTVIRTGYAKKTQTIRFESDAPVSIALSKQAPKSVAISYDIRDGQADSLVKAQADLTVDGSPVSGTAGTAQGTLTLPYGDSAVTICATADYFKDSGNCANVIPDADKPAHLTLSRKQVTVAVSVTDQSGGSIDDPSIQVDGYTYESGDKSHDFGARAGKRSVSASADGYKETAKQVAANRDQTVSLSLPRVYACNDEKDNDGDGKIDADDSGCVDSQASTSHIPGSDGFVYQPDDDNEMLRGHKVIHGIYTKTKYYVSGEENHQQVLLIQKAVKDFPTSIQIGLDITIQFQKLVSTDEKNESFKVKVHTGPNDDHLNYSCTSRVVPDEGKDGWKDVSVSIPHSCFAHGTAYKIVAVYAGPDGSDSDVVFYLPKQDYSFSISWFYEPEEVPKNSSTSINTGTRSYPNVVSSNQPHITSKTTEEVVKQ